MVRKVIRLKTLIFLCGSLSMVGCGNTLNCAIRGDNVRGRVTFGTGISIVAGSDLVVEWSDDSFATVGGFSRFNNQHGLVAVPYSMCADSGVAIGFRAYQDVDKNLTIDTGEANGRFDGTSNGNANFTTKTIPASTTETWETIEGIDIELDT